ncbi:MAG TPA: hypothetical protein PKW95_14630 [bacterium]|nr:hypothetical protein [bacterium]
MLKAVLTLEEQNPDFREKERSFKFTMQNTGDASISLLSITPRLPKGVRHLENEDVSTFNKQMVHAKICEELTLLVNEHLFLTSKEIQQRMSEKVTQFAQVFIDSLKGMMLFTSYLKILFKMNKQFLEMKHQADIKKAFEYRIHNFEDAEYAFNNLLQNAAPDIKKIYNAKMEQLNKIERTTTQIKDSPLLATIEPGSLYSKTFVMNFPRKYVNPSNFGIDIEVIYTETKPLKSSPNNNNAPAISEYKEIVDMVSTSTVISPRPLALIAIVMWASLGGIILKEAMNKQDISPKFFWELLLTISNYPGWMAELTAFVFFCIYEYTEMGKKINMTLGWRTAVLIGVFSGMAADRILDAIKLMFQL